MFYNRGSCFHRDCLISIHLNTTYHNDFASGRSATPKALNN